MADTNATKDISNYCKALTVLHGAMLAGQVLFTGITAFMRLTGAVEMQDAALAEIIQYAIPGISALTIFASFSIFNNKLPSVRSLETLPAKLDAYRKISIISFALAEGGVIFAVIAYFITGMPIAAYCAIAGIIYFFLIRPRKEKIITNLDLSSNERELLEGS